MPDGSNLLAPDLYSAGPSGVAPGLMPLLSGLAAAGSFAGASRLPVTSGQVWGGLGQGVLAGINAANQSAIGQAQARNLNAEAGINELNLQGFRDYRNSMNAPAATAPVTAASPSAGQPQITGNGVIGQRSPGGAAAQLGLDVGNHGNNSTGSAPDWSVSGTTGVAGSGPKATPTAQPPGGPFAGSAGAPSMMPNGPGSSMGRGNGAPPTDPYSAEGKPQPLFGVANITQQARLLSTFPAGVPLAQHLLGLLPQTGPNMYLGVDGSVHLLPGAAGAMFQQSYAQGSGEGAGGYPAKLALEEHKPYPLRGQGASLVQDGRVIAQVPVEVHGVDANGHPFTTFTYTSVNPNGAPSGGGGALLNPPSTGTSGGSLLNPNLPPPALGNNGGTRGAGAPPPAAPLAAQLSSPNGPAPPSAPSAAPAFSRAPAPGLGAAPPGPQITQNAQGLPSIQAGLSPVEEESQKEHGVALEKYGEGVDEAGSDAIQQNFLLDEMRAEAPTFGQGKFADIQGDLNATLDGFRSTFGMGTTPSQPLADWQSFEKNASVLTRQAVRALSSRAAVQEFQMVQSALPSTTMSQGGFNQIADQMSSINDFAIAKQGAANQWRQSHSQTLNGFDTYWNAHVTPGAFLVRRLSDSPAQLQQLASSLQGTAQGRAALKQLLGRVQWAHDNHVFDALDAGQ